MENDPSTSGQSEARTVFPTRITERFEDLKELHLLCQQGMLYEVEAWIRDWKPLQIAPGVKVRGHYSALEIALDTGQHSLCRLLLRSGYRIDIEKHYLPPGHCLEHEALGSF